MTVLAECPNCRRKQSTKNKKCKCGENLVQSKKAKKIRYWIDYPLPDGKVRRESVGSFEGLNAYSIRDARTALAKRTVQKREKRILDMLPESTMTCQELTGWYLELKSVKKLKSFIRIKQALSNFNTVFGNMTADEIKPVMLENYQEDRERQGRADATIDMEISIAKTMIIKSFDNDMVDGRVLKAFRSLKKRLKKGGNARKRTLKVDEYVKLINYAPQHLKAFIIVAYNTGMRVGELRLLKWSYVDKVNKYIRLPAETTKEGRSKNIPINHHVRKTLDSLPRSILHNFVFTYKRQPITNAGGLKRSFKTACIETGIPHGSKTQNGLIFHDIRRTVKTNMLNAGVDKVHRDLILGHSLKGMDAHYMAPDDGALTKAMDKYTLWLDGQISNIDHFLDHEAKSKLTG
ncbi:MAG: tyrosine-type recombinase/integrase [Desulfobacterales bacterium]|nr:tyrosine-type recombinase/integrase [Desulfobacterales bacterium]